MPAHEDPLFKQEGYDLMGAAFEVYKEKGSGFLEDVYQECLEKELAVRKIPFQAKPWLEIFYKGEPLRQGYEPDLLVCGGSSQNSRRQSSLFPSMRPNFSIICVPPESVSDISSTLVRFLNWSGNAWSYDFECDSVKFSG